MVGGKEELLVAVRGGFFDVRLRVGGGILDVGGVRIVYETHAWGERVLSDWGTGCRVGVQAPGEAEDPREEDKGAQSNLAGLISLMYDMRMRTEGQHTRRALITDSREAWWK